MYIETEHLIITEFDLFMAESVHLNSLDDDTRRFVPDEVFETVEEATETITFLMGCYGGKDGPFVYPVLLKDRTCVGYVQAVPLEEGGWEIGYHIGSRYTHKGYATEAVRAFLPVVMEQLGIDTISGICLRENAASVRVLEHCDFEKEFDGTGEYQGQASSICKFRYRK